MKIYPEKNEWQPVQGVDGVQLMPLMSSAASDGSNIYLVEFSELFLLVDLGSDQKRLAAVADSVNAADPTYAKPVLVVLTHCHIDHIAAAPGLECLQPRQIAIAGHFAGTSALAAQDQALTISFLFKTIPPLIDVDLVLFGALSNPEVPGSNCFRFVDTTLTLSSHGHDVPQVPGLGSQNIMVNNRSIATVYATPGHSPDSICLLIGGILFCGDLPFGGNPAVAGIPGWNRKDLLTSFDVTIELLNGMDTALICAGHGPVMDRERALAQLTAAAKKASAINGIIALDAERSAFLKSYAQTLLYEANSTFTIILGRLMVVAEQLELLDEKERCREIQESTVLADMDELIERFYRSANREDRPGEPESRVPIVTGVILGKVDKMLGDSLFTNIIDAARLRRAKNLILDFSNALRGISYRELLRPEKPEYLVQCLLDELSLKPYRDDDFMAAADDHDHFVEQLVRRLAYQPLFSEVTFCPELTEGLPMVAVELSHLMDTLVGLCELLAVSGGRQIRIGIAAVDEDVHLTLATELGASPDLVSDKKVEFYAATLHLYGAKFAVQRQQGILTLGIIFPPAEGFDDPIV
jgi:glyoxylase-like metal-dependent hydrolase (beta-lactamase superfamily II)